MLNQEKTGKYIAEKRKQLGMTQKQLAEQIGLTDKAVSKWERGKSIPDSAVMEDLCGILRISVNEFLSGEDIQKEAYSDEAEKNMRILINKSNVQKRNTRIVVVSMASGFVFMLLGLYAAFLNIHGLKGIARFIDMPSLLFLLGIVLAILTLSGAVADFLRAFPICFGKGKADNGQLQKSAGAVKMALILNILAGIFIFIGQAILTLPAMPETGNILQVFSVLLLAIWYSVFLDMLLMPVLCRLQNLMGEQTGKQWKERKE